MKHRTFHLLLAIFLFCAYCNAQELGKHDFIRHGLFYRDIKNPGYGSTTIRLPGKTYAVIISGGKDLIVSTTSVKGQTTHLSKGQKNYTVHYNSVGGINGVVMVTFVVNGVKTETYKLQ